MTTKVTAIYDHGMLKLTEPIPIADGTAVEVIVIADSSKSKQTEPYEILSRIAKMPIEPGGRKFSSMDHDDILFNESGEA